MNGFKVSFFVGLMSLPTEIENVIGPNFKNLFSFEQQMTQHLDSNIQ